MGSLARKDAQDVTEVLTSQHALHGMFGRVFERLGGEDFLYEWAEDNPGRFLSMMARMTPGLAPTQGIGGDVQLHVHATLAPTALDVVSDQ